MILEREEIFSHALEDSQILVVDRIRPSRKRIVQALSDMNFDKSRIHETESLSEAERLINSHEPKIIISDYKIKGGTGLDVFKFYKDSLGQENHCSFILISTHTDQISVSQAAEENIDGYILKPYRKKELAQNLKSSIESKLFKGEFYDLLEEGIDYFEKYQLDNARKKLDLALEKNLDNSLVYNYFGQILLYEDKFTEAKIEFEKGLSLNPIQHHCMLGLLEVYMKIGNLTEAYKVSKKIVKYYPGNQFRMGETIRLAIKLGKFNDLEDFYKVFVSSGKRGSHLAKHICSGLLVAGKYFLIKEEVDKCVQFYNELTSIYQGEIRFIRAMVENLTHYGQHEHAKSYIKFFPFFERESDDYKIAEFLTFENDKVPEQFFEEGIKLLKQGINNYYLNLKLIEYSNKLGKIEFSQELVKSSKKIWPNKKRELDKILH